MEDKQTESRIVSGYLISAMNLRKTPSLKGEILQIIPKGTKITINLDEGTKDFFKVNIKSVPGYLMKKFVKIPKKVDTDAKQSNTNNG